MSRKITVSTVSIALDMNQTAENPCTVKGNLKRAAELIRVAASRKSDVVCLPECFGTAHTFKPIPEQAEPVPQGEIAHFAAAMARRRRMHVVAPLLEKRGKRVYNSTYIFDRKGAVLGRYDKTHLPIGEREYAVPGNRFPVIRTEFGKVGILTCYDLNFPEAARILKVKGAEIIFWPTMWSGPSEYFCEATLRVRAMENQICFVSANYVYGERRSPARNSYIVNWDGAVLASTGPFEGVATAEIDLDAEKFMQATEAHLMRAHRRPEIYGEITRTWRRPRPY